MKNLLFIVLLCGITSAAAQPNHFKELLYNGRYAEFIRLVQSEIPTNQITGDTARMLGQAFEGMAKYREAYNIYKTWLSSDTLRVDALNAVARTALQLGKPNEAESCYLKAYALDTSNFNAAYQLAKLYFQLKDYQNSLSYYELLLERDSTNINFLKGAGDCIAGLGFLPTAINFYAAAVDLNKENVSLTITLVNAILGVYETDPNYFLARAQDACDTALVYNPENPALKQSKGVLYFLAANYTAADSLMSALLVSGDSSAITLRYTAMARTQQGAYRRAIPCLEKLYEYDSTHVETLMLLATSLGQSGYGKRALSLLDKVEKLIHPTEEERYNLAFQRASVYNGLDVKKAQQYYWEAYKLSKKNRKAILAWFARYYHFTKEDFDQESEEDYAKGLYFHVQYLRAVKEEKAPAKKAAQTEASQHILELFIDDMIFKDLPRLLMLSPEGAKEWVAREELLHLARGKEW